MPTDLTQLVDLVNLEIEELSLKKIVILNPSSFYIKKKLITTFLYENDKPICKSIHENEIKKLYFEISSGIINTKRELINTIYDEKRRLNKV